MSKLRDAWNGLILTLVGVPAYYRYVRAMRALGADPIEAMDTRGGDDEQV